MIYISKSEQINRDIMNESFNLLAIVFLFFLIGFFLEETIDSSKLNNYGSLGETFDIISELFSILVALSIFTIRCYAYNKTGITIHYFWTVR